MIGELDSDVIQAILPHRYPMSLVDRLVELEPGIRAVGIKNVTSNEWFFPGHFPQQAVMPGVLVIEAMAQVAGIMMLTVPAYRGKIPFIAAIESARYYRPIVPGDVLRIEASTIWVRQMVGRVNLVARVEGKVVVKSEMTFALKDPPPSPEAKLQKLEIFPTEARETENRG